ncbi:MAG TPA: M48 family metallopeptidase [Methylomirabilota bacterium]|jgi:Zn-dependent protease with chaperone function|nr:M48 family metallopeptidase [Methylomirabilota bacterium]
MGVTRTMLLAAFLAVTTACATVSGGGSPQPQPSGSPRTDSTPAPRPAATKLDPAQAERLQRVMIPLLKGMNKPLDPREVKVGVMDDASINAANAGSGQFIVTTGLLQKANDDQLRGVLAHELAHDDLHHVAKAQTLGAGLNIGAIILDQIIPGSGAITPIAGELVARGYSRKEEYAADAHGAEILERVGYSRQVMIDTLNWLISQTGGSKGGFLATHPGTSERVEALKHLK